VGRGDDSTDVISFVASFIEGKAKGAAGRGFG